MLPLTREWSPKFTLDRTMTPMQLEMLLPRWRRWRASGTHAARAERTRLVRTRNGVARACRMGSGPPLVWIPDPPVVIEHYHSLAEQLATRYEVILVELPGIGFGIPNKDFRFRIAGAGAGLADVLAELGVRGATLVGTCLGGFAVQACANLAPARVERVVFLQTPSWPDGQRWLERRDPKSILRTPWIGQSLFQLFATRRIEAWFRYALADATRAGDFATIARSALDRGACFCLASLFQQFLAPEQVLPNKIAQPAIAIAGTADRSHKGTDWSLAASLGQNVEVLRFEHSGHFPDLEAPDRLIETLERFIRSH